MDEKLFEIILILLTLICAITTSYVVPFLKQKINANKIDEITKWVIRAVKAAEMIFSDPKSGEAKKRYVIKFIANMFNKKKEVITEEQILILLESAVQQLNSGNAPED